MRALVRQIGRSNASNRLPAAAESENNTESLHTVIG